MMLRMTADRRVSFAEREPVLEHIKQAYAEGRIDEEELDQRVHRALTVRTQGELDSLLADLSPVVSRVASGAEVVSTDQDRVLAALAHSLGAVTLVVGPLCMLGVKRPYVRQHAVAALNFQLTYLVLIFGTVGMALVADWVVLIVVAVAAWHAFDGRQFRYPFSLHLLK
jgi:uncharacterized Tic20 family protein